MGCAVLAITIDDFNLVEAIRLSTVRPKQSAETDTLEPLSYEARDDFDAGLAGFIQRGEALSNIDNPDLGAVLNVLKTNGTAYQNENGKKTHLLPVVLIRHAQSEWKLEACPF